MIENPEQMGKDRDPGDQQQHPPTTPQPTAPSPAPHGSHPKDPKMQATRVRLPDGVYKEFEVNRSSEGDALFQMVTRDLSIEERGYFSLCFYDKDEGTRHWLYNDKKILRQLKGLPWEFSFEVKFYPTTPTTLVDDHARYYLFLQLRRDILTGRLPATADTHALLGSFVAQMEFGDAPSQISDEYEQFIVNSKLVPTEQANSEEFKKIADLHRELRGQTTSEAETQFLDNCKHLALYGIHLFKATDKDKKPVDIGVGAVGINIYQDGKKLHTFPWQSIVKIGYKRSHFSIKIKAGVIGKDKKDEKTLEYKLPTHLASKRTWKCAVEHHTFFRLIQPEDKPPKSFFNFGSQRFSYQGRTQFQTKMASQMFDRPANVDRAPSSMSQPITSTEEQKLNTLNLTDTELEQRNFERYRRALTPKSYTRDDDAISSATFAKYSSRPSTLIVSTTSANAPPHDHDLSYSPRGLDDSNLSSAAYYMSERSSLRTPSSAYYPPSEYAASSSASAIQSPTADSPYYFEGQHRGEYHVQMRQQTTAPTSSAARGARRNLFGRASDTSRDSVRLVSFHEPVDPEQPIPNTYPVNELPEIPIERIVHVYHEGHYDRLSPRREQLPYGFGVYTPRNGVSHVDRLEPHGEMDQQPIRFFVDVRHSGASRRDPAKRISHPGKEDVKEKIDPKDYDFAPASTSDALHRTELARDVQAANIQQYSRRYHHGDSQTLNEPSTSTPQYRLVTHVQPLVVSHQRDARNGQQSSSNVNATISQREHAASTRVRRESPDADRRVRLSASVDRSGNVTDTTEDMARSSTAEVTTSTTVVEPTKKTKRPKIPQIADQKTREVRLVARVKSEPEEEQVAEPVVKEKKPKKEGSKLGFFSRTTKTTKTSEYPQTSDHFTGDLDTTDRSYELESSPFEHMQTPPSSRQKATVTTESAPFVQEKKRYRLIARFRHDGDEDVVEKPDPYIIASTSYDGPLEEIHRHDELDQTPIGEHSSIYHHGESWRIDKASSPSVPTEKSKKQKKENKTKAAPVKSPKKEKLSEPAEPETREVRLIARVRSDPDEEQIAEPVVKEKKPKKNGSKFGLFSRTTKTTKTTGYPETSEQYSGELDVTDRRQDLENSPLDHRDIPAYSPKKIAATEEGSLVAPSVSEKNRYRLIARFRHEGDEDEVEKPDSYAFASTLYDGPLEDIHRQEELDQAPIGDHSAVYNHGESWRKEETASPIATFEKKTKKVKSPKKAKLPDPVEPETREIRLIARVRSEPEEEYVAEPVVKEKKPEKEGSKFGFLSRATKTTKTTGYPETSEQFTGELDTTDRSHDLEGSSFEHRENPAYSPKKSEAYKLSETSSSHVEKKHYRLIARFRHEGDEDEVENTKIRPEAYGFASTSYDGPLEETNLERDVEYSNLGDHSTVYHHGEYWRTGKQPALPVATLEKKVKKVKSAKKPIEAVSDQPEKSNIRLIARILPDEEEEQTEASKPLKDSSSKSTFGFFKKTARTSKSSSYPGQSEGYTGSLEAISRMQDLDTVPFEHGEVPVYTTRIISAEDPVVQHEKKRYLIARFRHEGDEDEIEKPDTYDFATDRYEGPLNETARSDEVQKFPLHEHSTVYHHGESWRKEKPVTPVATIEKKANKVKSAKKEKLSEPVEPETKEVRLIARVRSEPEDEQVAEPVVKEKKPKKEGSKLGFFSRTTKTTKTTGYPETSEQFTGDLDTTDRSHDLESSVFERTDIPAYLPRNLSVEAATLTEVQVPEKKRYRLIARLRHEGDEDIVEKPEFYSFPPEAYEGALDETSRSYELEQVPLSDHSTVYHHGESWRKEQPVSPVATLEKKAKKVKSPKKEELPELVEPETKEVRLIARVRSEPEDEQVAEPVVKEKKPKKEGSKLGFFSRTTKTTKTTGYPETSEQFTGDLDTTDRSHDLEGVPFEHGDIPAYSPMKTVASEEDPSSGPAVPEKKRYRLIARFRHEGDEDEVEKPDSYAFASTLYEGPLEDIHRQEELDQAPIGDHSTVYHHGESWRNEKPVSPVATLEKKAKKVKSLKKAELPEPVEPETREIRLIARVRSEPEDEQVAEPVVKEKKPKKEGSKSKIPSFGFFHRTQTPSTSHPATSDGYTGPVDTTDRVHDLESAPFEHGEVPSYSAKTTTAVKSSAEPTEHVVKKRYRLIARYRHDGDEDVVEKPDPYAFASTSYDGHLEDVRRQDELDQTPIADYATVYHHGESWRKERPVSPVATLEKKPKKVKSLKKAKLPEPVEPETKEVRLIARVQSDPEEKQVAESVVKEKKPKKEGSKLGFFSRTAKTTKTTGYPETSEQFTGDLDTTDRSHDLEGVPFEHGDIPAYSPMKIVASEEDPSSGPAVPEKKRYRLIARFRHEGDEDEVEKPDSYAFASTLYEGPLEDIHRQAELDQAPIGDHSTVYHHGESWRKEKPVSPVATLEKKAKKVKSLKKAELPEPVEPETREIRLIARVRSEPEDEQVAEPVVKEKKPKKEGSKLGFFSRTTKTTKTTGYPETSEQFTGDLDTTDRSHDLEGVPFEHGDIPAYSPMKTVASEEDPSSGPAVPEKKRYRLIARFRHEGDEDEVEKPDSYAFASTLYEGPLEDIHRQAELDQAPIGDHSTVYHHGESWRKEKPVSPVATLEKKAKKVKSLKKAELPEPVEPETREIRLIARVRSEPEDEQVAEPVVKEKKPKKEGSKLGFFSRTTKTTKTTGYPETSEQFTGDLDTTDRSHDLEGVPFEHGDIPAYSPMKTVASEEDPSSGPAVPEKKRYRLIARFRHEGDEDEVEKPDSYAFASTLYEGPLEDIHRQEELDQAPIGDHSTVYHHGESWRKEKPVSLVATLEKKAKKVKSLKKAELPEPVEPETREIRLIARVRSEPEDEQVAEPVVKEKKPKKEGSKSRIPSFGFFHRTQTPSTSHPATSDGYTGPVDTTDRVHDLESAPFEHGEVPSYSAKTTTAVKSSAEPTEHVVKKRYRLIARYRHDGDEDVVEKPDPYAFASTSYDGHLEDVRRQDELDQTPIADYATVYHHGESWRKERPVSPVATLEKKPKKVKSLKKAKLPEPVEPETKEVRLIARVRSEPEDEQVAEPVVKEKKPKKEGSKLGFFSRTTKTTKTTGYPETSEQFTGDLDTTDRSHDLEGVPFEHGDIPAYSPMKIVASEEDPSSGPAVPEKKRYRLFARFRHEGDEDEVEKPDSYAFASTLYEGPLEDIHRQEELDQAPIGDHAFVYHHGESWRKEKPVSPVATLEKKAKKVKSLKKAELPEPVEPETREIRLIARVRSEPEDEQVAEPVVKEKKPKKEGSKSRIPSFGFFHRTQTPSTSHPATSDGYTGPVDTTDRVHDLESAPFEHGEVPSYSAKTTTAVKSSAEPTEHVVKKRYRLIARYRHDGDEDVVEKPDPYAFASTSYDGHLEDVRRQDELDQTPIADYATVYHHGESWRKERPVSPVATLEKKPKKVKSLKKAKLPEPVEPETKEVRLIARVQSDPEEKQVAESVVKEKKPKKEGSKLGFFSRTTKTTKATGYPETSEQFTGDLDTTDRSHDLEGVPFEHGDIPAYSPKKIVASEEEPSTAGAVPEKKRYHLIARFRHEGDEDEVEKPDPYVFASISYDGPLEDIQLQSDIETLPISDHSNVYHHGESWKKEQPVSPVATVEKKAKKVKSPNKEKLPEQVEPDTKEIRLIARVRSEPEEEQVVKEKKPKKEGFKLGFFSRTTKTTKTIGYPGSSEQFTGELDTTDRSHDLEGVSFEHGEIPVYSPKKRAAEESPEEHAQPEKKRYRLIARFRHEGDEDEVEIPDPYGFAETVHQGPLDETTRHPELEQYPLSEHSTVYHQGDSRRTEPIAAKWTVEKKKKKEKKAKTKKETAPEPVEPETRAVRLIARVPTSQQEEPSSGELLKKEKKPKKEGSKFGLFSRPTNSEKTEVLAEPVYQGPLDSTTRSHELENIPFDHFEVPIHKTEELSDVPSEPVVHEEKKRFRWFARFRHDGDEDEVEKPGAYAFASDLNEGPLDETSLNRDIDQIPIADFATVYHHGESWKNEKPVSPVAEMKQKKVKAAKEPTPEPEESREVRLVARIQPLSHEDEEPVVEEKASPVKEQRLSSFNIFHRHSKPTGYPEPSAVYDGDLDVTGLSREVEKAQFKSGDIPEYTPKNLDTAEPAAHHESRIYRLFTRFRYEGEEDVVENPSAYAFVSTVYDGPLDEISKQSEIEQSPIGDHSTVYHHGESWRKDVSSPVSSLEKKQKKVKPPKKEKSQEPVEPEKHEVKLLAKVKSEEPEAGDVVEKEDSSRPFRLRFFSLNKKNAESSYPESSPIYEGPLDVTSPADEFEKTPYLHGQVPRYSPKAVRAVKSPEKLEKKKATGMFARFRHEGDEDIVEKPAAYGFAPTSYDGPLEEISRESEIYQTPIEDHSTVYHHGESWRNDDVAAAAPEKKTKKKVKEEPEGSDVRLVARVLPQGQEPSESSDEKSPRKDDKENKPFRFRFFSLSNKGAGTKTGYPETSTTYEGPLEVTERSQPLEHVEFWRKEFPAKEKVIVSTEIEQQPEVQENQENVPPKSSEKTQRFNFLRGVKPSRSTRGTSYPSTFENYTGPLDVTDRNLDLETIPFEHSGTIPKYSPRKPAELSTEADRKYRLIARILHDGDEDEVEKSKLHPVFYSFPAWTQSGNVEETPLQAEVEECPIQEHSSVYHSGYSGARIRDAIIGKLNKRTSTSGVYQEPKADVKLIARVLPMKKSLPKESEGVVSDDVKIIAEPLTRSAELEPRALTDLIGPSTSTARNSALVVENTVNYFPSSLQYEPRAARIEGYTDDGHGYVEVRLERRAEVQLEPVYVLRETTRSHAYLSTATAYFSGASSSTAGGSATTRHSVVPFVGSVSEDETGLHFSTTPLNMSPPERPSFLARLGFKRDKKKDKKDKKGKKENESSETSDSEHEEKREFAVVEFQPHEEAPPPQKQEGPKKPEHRTHKSPGRRTDEPMNEVTVVVTGGETLPAELGATKEVRHETREQQFRLTGDGYTSGFNPNDPSLMATIQRAERLNASSPRLEHAERTFTVRANAPLPVSFEESGQPYTTVSTWQETSDLPEQVEVYTDENGRQITRTVKSSQVKHTVQTQSFQNYIVDGDQVPVGVVDVERSREQLTPLGQQASSSSGQQNGDGIVETQTRTMTYEAQGGENAAPPGWAEQGLGEYVSSKSVTQGNRTIETITYKTEKDGVIETHVEHRVTIHSDGDIDHDAELSQAILEATQMNPDMVVEKIEVRQETTQ
ncbi:unnamed protein product [Caenorhabditis sp. 36 PRJEB53466]|nr:unnamed protein product [Caenorhabditis sp. 36 PRJEB53466]